MARKTSGYDQIRKARAVVRPVRVTFAYGQCLTGTMDLSIAQLERMLAMGEIEPAVYCTTGCGDHIAYCPEIGPWLADWPTP